MSLFVKRWRAFGTKNLKALTPPSELVLLEQAEIWNIDDEKKTLVGLGIVVAVARIVMAVTLVMNALIG